MAGPSNNATESYSRNICCSINCCYRSDLTLQARVSDKIDRQLQAEAKIITRKLLLLGPGECGKSTYLKQMQIIHLDGFSPAMMESRKYFAYSNIKQSMLVIVQAMPLLNIAFEDDRFKEGIRNLEENYVGTKEYEPLTPELAEVIKKLWQNEKVQECYERRGEYQLLDSAKYFFDNIDRIAASDYMPTVQDILMIRVPTVGVNTIEFELDGGKFAVFDAGGQRAQRRKWIRYFDNVDAIIFIAAISEYNQTLREDNQKNRLLEAFELFQNIANQDYFSKAGIILFLNKKDIFSEKINKYPLSQLFPSYIGGANYTEAVNYISKRFINFYKNHSPLYIFETCATDTQQIRQITTSVFDAVFTKNLKHSGF